PRRVLMLGLAVAALGWVADTQTKVVSDVRDLVPSNMKALKDAKTLQDTTDVSGEIDVMVGAPDLTSPKVLNWMISFQQGALCAHGYQPQTNCPNGKPPAGYRGRPVLAADANHELASTSRRAFALLVGLIAVFLVLLAVRRKPRLAAVPLIPIALATGWSAALLFLLRIPLNPMSAALGALVIAI